MEFKELSSFLRRLTQLNLQQPEIVLVSGVDIELGNVVTRHLRDQLKQKLGTYEFIVFSPEPGEGLRLQTELANIPIFAPYRFLLVSQGEEVLQDFLSSSAQANAFAHDLNNLPERTLLMILYAGTPPRRLLQQLRENPRPLLHLITPRLYPNQMEAALTRAVHARKLKLNQSAFYLLLENLDLKSGTIEQVMDQLRSITQGKEEVGTEEVRSVLFPSQGWDPFALVDALLADDLGSTLREYKRFHSSVDNFFVLLKLILRRTDEIRLAAIAYAQHIQEGELIALLGLGNRHPFVQKKILERLRREVPRFNVRRQLEIYDFLITMQKNFRSQTPLKRQATLFQKESLRLFHGSDATII